MWRRSGAPTRPCPPPGRNDPVPPPAGQNCPPPKGQNWDRPIARGARRGPRARPPAGLRAGLVADPGPDPRRAGGEQRLLQGLPGVSGKGEGHQPAVAVAVGIELGQPQRLPVGEPVQDGAGGIGYLHAASRNSRPSASASVRPSRTEATRAVPMGLSWQPSAAACAADRQTAAANAAAKRRRDGIPGGVWSSGDAPLIRGPRAILEAQPEISATVP